jgi:glycerate kinase
MTLTILVASSGFKHSLSVDDVTRAIGDGIRHALPATRILSAPTVDGSVGPVFISATVARLRHFATVLGLMPSSRRSCASAACDRCIAALTACVVVALP